MRLQSLRSRVEKLEGARSDDLLTIINVSGWLPPPAPLHARVGGGVLTQGDGEDAAIFRERVIAAAELAREKFVVIGTFPPWKPWDRDCEAPQARQRAECSGPRLGGEPDSSWSGIEP
jgi:hypothetical protein